MEVKRINTIAFNKLTGGECWVKTNGNNTEVDWLADTGLILRIHKSNRIHKTKFRKQNNDIQREIKI